jgi:hypothetical protein
MQMLHIPASYDVWLTGLKTHFDRHRGAQAELARFLANLLTISTAGAQVKLSRIVAGQRKPDADLFLDIAAWLQRQQDALNDPPVVMPMADAPLPPIPARRELPSYRTGQVKRPAKVAEP